MDKAITVLYVDDEKPNTFLFEANFKSQYDILTAHSGEEGLALLDKHQQKIKVVISDMRMPAMNGVEFIQQANTKYDHISYYILTAFGFNQEIEKAIESNLVKRCFSKPINKKEISAEIDALNY